MSTANQQTLAKTGTEGRPPILKKGSYVSWVSRFLRFLDNKREEGEWMQYSIDNGPLKRKWVDDLKRTPNDIYNSVDACEDAQGINLQLLVKVNAARHKLTTAVNDHAEIFGNMKRVGKGFSGRETPLFPTMMVQAQEEVGEGSANPTDPHHTPTIIQPSTSQPQKKQKPRKPKRKDTEEDASKQGRKIHDIDADKDITLENVYDAEMVDTGVLNDEEVAFTTASVEVSTSSPTELTLAQTLIEIKSAKPKVKGVVIEEQSESTTRTRPQQLPSKDKVRVTAAKVRVTAAKQNLVLFETYVKAKDLDLWHIILNGDFPPVAKNEVTQILEVVPFEEQSDDLKKKLAKNNEAKMVLYNALPKKEYERIFMCKTAKDIWQSLLITHQGNSQVKDNKIDLLVQQYEQFTILEEESIDSGFARFNTIITSLKALDEGFSSKNYVRKFLRALHPKWRAKVTAIEESKDLSSLALDELIGNLKVHEVVMEKDSEIYRGKKERIKSIALKAKKESSDDETSTSESDDEEYAMAIRNFEKFFRRKGKIVRQPREEKKSFRQRDEKKGRSDWNVLDAVIQIISLAIVQNHLATKIKRPSLEVLGVIAKMTPKTKLTIKLVSWLNRQMRFFLLKRLESTEKRLEEMSQSSPQRGGRRM
ncbi:zf-CCHC domain-containing protein [Tanacetum coccineum]|uniref:Zf-CCHC domain-containing protein n=1 Tax=Tanacetum coccineum TaxID=301880 RepID=A0ABQ5HHE4_9ASTR